VALLRLHRLLTPGQSTDVCIRWPEATGPELPGLLGALIHGAGFALVGHRWPGRSPGESSPAHPTIELTLERRRTLPDTVGPGMRALVVGLNPSLHAADAGYGFAGPGNRFWPAAIAAGLVSTARDPLAALEADGVGMTDLAKRATARAAELDRDEYRAGLQRLDRLCEWLRPSVVCVVGITGWRAAAGDRTASLGVQSRGVGGCPVYVMPNPSGLNAHTDHDDLVRHFHAALEAGTTPDPADSVG
jgi:TDG/mug DNA glycosylase family protein